MAQFLDIFGFLSVGLRGLALIFEALAVGGVIFQVFVAREYAHERAWRWIGISAILLLVTELAAAGSNIAILLGTTNLLLADVLGADFCKATLIGVVGAAAVAVVSRFGRSVLVATLACILILLGSAMMSHSNGRLEWRLYLMGLTVVHHAAGAAWIGGLPFLLASLKREGSVSVTRRFSSVAMGAVAALALTGTGLARLYVGSASALTGTTYGAMLASKIVMTGMLLFLGALNFRLIGAAGRGTVSGLFSLGRFAEAEWGIGITVLLTAASLTSTPPAIDVQADRVTAHEIAQRMAPRWPRLSTPPLSDLSPVTPITVSQNSILPASFVPGQSRQSNNAADIAWSEYNHHWAGLTVLAIGFLALLSRRFRWARHWPLAFLGLAAFLLVRSDSENWPLGPRGFWESFLVAEVAQHRLFVALIIAFAIFEWAIQTNRIEPRRAGLVFPLVCAAGGALLMTHSHSLGNVKEEFLVELSHIPLALFAVVAGWSRWLEIRLPGERTRVAAWIWPVCFVLIGTVLVLYRES
jgi:putative copper resistance protein D